MRNAAEAWGNGLLAVGILALAAATPLGLSGFVRGGFGVGVFGVLVAVVSGILSMAMLLCSYRLDRVGVSPMAQFGLRFPLYVLLAFGAFVLGFDHKEDVPTGEIAVAVLVGLVVMAFPMYAVQRAVALVPPLTIGAITALGPLIVFVLQLVEGRVDYAPATLVGLLIFFAGGVLAAFSSARDRQGKATPIARS